MVPLGYDSNERRIAVNEAEADRVRMIFRSYLKPTKDSNKTSTRSTPSMMRHRPISAAKRTPAGRCYEPNTTTAASPAATPTGRPCGGSSRTCGQARST